MFTELWIGREFIQVEHKCGYDSILLWKLQFPTPVAAFQLSPQLRRQRQQLERVAREVHSSVRYLVPWQNGYMSLAERD